MRWQLCVVRDSHTARGHPVLLGDILQVVGPLQASRAGAIPRVGYGVHAVLPKVLAKVLQPH